jgi:hypothetical protein
MVSPTTLLDLAGQITTQAVPPATPNHTPLSHAQLSQTLPRRHTTRRRLLALAAVPVAAGVAAATLVMTPASHGGANPAYHNATTTTAQPLAFIVGNGSITVLVRNPLADPSRYRAEFAKHHLNITLKLVPVSPSLVGTLIYSDGSSLATITAKGRCYTGGGGSACPVGVRIPAGFHGSADLVFGRAARPGEQFMSTASAFAPGEAMHGMRVTGMTVSQVLAELHARNITVPVFHYDRNNDGALLRQVPGNWHVYDAAPWAPGQVMLWVGPTVKQPSFETGVPIKVTKGR